MTEEEIEDIFEKGKNKTEEQISFRLHDGLTFIINGTIKSLQT